MFSQQLLTRLKSAKTVAVLTGAGISAESGVPTFRGEQGLWKKFRPEELANFDAFMQNPKLVWEWYNYRKKIISEAYNLTTPCTNHSKLREIRNLPFICK